jgi:hypothetical protein
MQLPWWGWALLSVAGFSGTVLICSRLAATRVAPATINVYVFAVGLLAFGLYAGLTKADLRLPAGERWWLLPLAVTVFASNYAVVTAYQSAPNVGYVKAVGVGELALVTLVIVGIALVHGRPLDLPWWKMAGMALSLAGAVLVCLDAKKSPPNDTGPVVRGAGIDTEDGYPGRPPGPPRLVCAATSRARRLAQRNHVKIGRRFGEPSMELSSSDVLGAGTYTFSFRRNRRNIP